MNVCRQHAGKTRRYPRKVDCDHEAGCIVAIHGTQQSRAIMACAYYLSVNRSETNPRGEAILAIFTHALRTQRNGTWLRHRNIARSCALRPSDRAPPEASPSSASATPALPSRARRGYRGGENWTSIRHGFFTSPAHARDGATIAVASRWRRCGPIGAAPRARFHVSQPRAVALSAGYRPGIRGPRYIDRQYQ